jgi:hypothetical protein
MTWKLQCGPKCPDVQWEILLFMPVNKKICQKTRVKENKIVK